MSWKQYEFRELAVLSSDKYYPTKSDEELPCIELEHIDQVTGRLLGTISSREQKSTKNVFKKNQVLYGKLRPYLRKYYMAEFDGVCSTEIWVFNGKKDIIINDYLFYLVQTDQFNKSANVSSGSKMPRANWDYVGETVFKIPSIFEQKKISRILAKWDKAIELKEKLIEEKRKQKTGLMQKLLTGRVRLSGFDGEWKEVKLRTVLKKVNEKSHITNGLELYSLTIENGVTPKTNRYNREFLVKTDNKKYKITKLNDIVYNPANLRFGAIAVNRIKSPVLLSPIYEVLRLKNDKSFNLDFIGQLLTWDRTINLFSTMAEGTLVERMAVKIDTFLDVEFKMPISIEEQTAIAFRLDLADKEIDLLEKEIVQLKEQKKGLMQLLLTGIVRVNTQEN